MQLTLGEPMPMRLLLRLALWEEGKNSLIWF